MLTVVNGKKVGFIGKDKIYIGRNNSYYQLKGSVLANPYCLGKDGTREEVIEKYRVWLWQQIQLKLKQNQDSVVWDELVRIGKKHTRGESIQLSCYCHPEACHGDVIIRCLNWLINQGYIPNT